MTDMHDTTTPCGRYSVMQSDGFYGDVVSDSFHKAYPDEDKILEKIYRSKYVRIVIMKI